MPTFSRQILRFILLYLVRPILLLLGALLSSFYNVLFAWWLDPLRRTPSKDGFPQGFRVQRIGVTRAMAVSVLPAAEIARYFREHPETAKAPLDESYDKRYSPSTFISESGDGSFRVGWCTRDAQYECVKECENLPDAATDYLLFSLGKSSKDGFRCWLFRSKHVAENNHDNPTITTSKTRVRAMLNMKNE